MEYNVQTPRQLAQALRSQRNSKRLTQKAAGAPVGLLPKTVSALESSPERSSVESLFKLLSTLEDDVLKWYHLGRKNYMYHDTDNSVAEAVKSTHPDEALAIWKRVAEWEIARVKPAAYKVAAPYLRKIRALYRKQKRADKWNTYLSALRQQHKAKRRLIEILNSL